MSGLILKDLLNLKKQSKVYIAFIIFYGFLAFTSKDTSFLNGVICIFCAMLPITALAYDERSNWDRYALSMPINRKDIIISKYLLGILCSFLGFIICFLFNIFSNSLSKETLALSLLFFGISIILISILLPILFKFGVEKGRLIMMIVLFSPTIIIVAISKLNLSKPSEETINTIIHFAPFIAPIIVLVVLILSIFISLNIYKNKDL
ncbi:ABC-2 transporter permease [Clostridium chauvoei]|uniref:ABC-2 transporter permease n=2 Tax=Clostridium chauvoei TaxID=46867 RepID=A0A1U6IX26_9CLOT|nr:ABC-2 transporter permease [Clostridium chauvoei]ATD54156.1 hypothetical protein BTM20_02475 [Clostridium chauvoei]ATD58164.1 hypothetical protein BTM21_10605 [Clostridium chauvoei]MBX7281355.1 ABC-2 transporter permease [Clostridium chauvoei]MBX7283837.1 ABC-2 transporter permease [Clostridium chauvoei]MBX7286444.1 ABC-2 transporter permease [Clostridium chauvoei]